MCKKKAIQKPVASAPAPVGPNAASAEKASSLKPTGLQINFKLSEDKGFTCPFDANVHYLFDASKRDEVYPFIRDSKEQVGKSIANIISNAVAQGGVWASASSVDFTQEIKLSLIQPIIHQAIETALSQKEGNLYLEPIGLLQAGIEPDAYAQMLVDEIFNLPIESLNQLTITFPVITNEKYKEVEYSLRDAIMALRLKQWTIESLQLDAADAKTVDSVGKVIDVLLSSQWEEQLDMLFTRFKYFRNSIEKTASDFQKQLYLERKEQLFGHLSSLIMPVFKIENSRILKLVDDFLSLLKKASIDEELKTFKQDNFSEDGFVERDKKGRHIGSNLQLIQSDLITAKYQLAITYPEHQEGILNILVCTKDNIAERLQYVASQGDYPRHILLHSSAKQAEAGGHWTRLSIVQDKRENGKSHLTVTHTNSYDKSDVAWLTPMLKAAYPAVQCPKVTISTNSVGTMHQTDSWTCGYHALTGAVRDLGVPDVPDSDLRTDVSIRTRGLQNWLFNLIFGRSYDEYLGAWQKPPASPDTCKSDTKPKGVAGDFLETPASHSVSLASLQEIKTSSFKSGNEFIYKSKITERMQTLTNQILALEQTLKTSESSSLSIDTHNDYDHPLGSLKKGYRQLESYASSDSGLSVVKRQEYLQPLLIRIEKLDKTVSALKGSIVTTDVTEPVIVEPTTEEVDDPLLIANQQGNAYRLKEKVEQLTPNDLSKKDHKRYLAMRSIINASWKEPTSSPAGRLYVPKQQNNGSKKTSDITKALGQIDWQLKTKLLGLDGDVSVKQEQIILQMLSQKYEAIAQKRSKNEPVSCSEVLIEEQYNRLPKIGNPESEKKWLDDPDRIRAILNAWKNPQSNFFKAVNAKRYSFLGCNLTFFSGKDWGDIINGDSRLVKEMKAAEQQALEVLDKSPETSTK